MQIKQHRSLLCVILLSTLTGCNGGSSGGSNNVAPPPPDEVELHPLAMQLSSDNKINGVATDYVDLQMVGAHPKFKLIFTNTNPVAVVSPTGVAANQNWVDVQAMKNTTRDHGHPTGEEKSKIYDAIPALNKFFILDTNNNDDCRNQKRILQPNESCSLYLMGTWAPNYNTTTTDMSFPIEYRLQPAPNVQSKTIFVGQCDYYVGEEKYHCRPDTDRLLFMKYKMTPTNKTTLDVNYISLDGNYAYHGEDSIGFTIISTMPVNYINGSLNFDVPQYTFKRPKASTHITPGIILDGTRYWLQSFFDGFQMLKFDATGCHTYTIPHGDDVDSVTASAQDLIVTGLDGSTWVNLLNANAPITFYGTDRYNILLDKFEYTNVSWVYGVNPDGVVIGRQKLELPFKATYGCWTKSNVPNVYNFQPINGYTGFPNDFYYDTFKSHNAIYLPMLIPNAYTVTGRYPVGLFKVHTKDAKGNIACYIDPDDFVIIPSDNGNNFLDYAEVHNTKKYTTIYNPRNGAMVIDPASIYLGK